jgi:hypothetical protein
MTLGVEDEGTGMKIVRRKIRSSGRTAGQSGDEGEVEGYTTQVPTGMTEVSVNADRSLRREKDRQQGVVVRTLHGR